MCLAVLSHSHIFLRSFLNERDFHIQKDEHELMLRAYLEAGVKCGKYDVGFESAPLASPAPHRASYPHPLAPHRV